MEGADAWTEAARGGQAVPRDNRIQNRIMLRFRPIAPKPAYGGSNLADGDSQGSPSKSSSLPVKRTKRKYVRVRRNTGNVKKNNDKSISPEKYAEGSNGVAVVTLQLMPEKEAPEKASFAGDSWCKNVDLNLTVEKIQILDNPKPAENSDAEQSLDPASAPEVPVVESWMTVESVTGTCMVDGDGGLGCTDAEKLKNLETDTCPGFVSDGYYRVPWVNEAFKRMVVSESTVGKPLPEVVVWLKVKDNAGWLCYSYPAFTCGVRLQYTWRNEKCTKMVPCDVWRLDCGGFAWRLDVKAALSLGL